MVSEFYLDSEHPVKGSDGKEIEEETNKNQLSKNRYLWEF